MASSVFDLNLEHFNPGWTVERAPTVSQEKTKELLSMFVSDDFHLPFVRVFDPLAQEAERWKMMELELLQNLDGGLPAFKHRWTKRLSLTAKRPWPSSV